MKTWTIIVFLFGSIIAVCQSGPAKKDQRKNPKAIPEERLHEEGKRTLKNDYYQSRRQPPESEPEFSPARRRFEAYQDMKARERASSLSSFVWENIGPAPILDGQTPSSSPRYPSEVTGRVSCLAIDAVDNAVYVGGAQGGLWKSTDNGASWIPLTDDLGSIAIGSVAIDPAPHNPGEATLYIGTGEGNGSCDSYGGVGVYKSIDSGATWNGPFGLDKFVDRGIPTLAVDRTNSNVILAGSSSGISGVGCQSGPNFPIRGIYRSTDGGTTWTHTTSVDGRSSVVIQDPVNAQVWWAAMWYTGNGNALDGGLLKSINGGASWSQIAGTAGLPAASSTTGRCWITATDDGGNPAQSVLYYANASNSGSVYKSVDSGASWSNIPAATGFCDGQCFYDMPIYVEPGDPDTFYTGGAGTSGGTLPVMFMRSMDGGSTFLDKVRSDDMTTAVHADAHAIISWPGQPNRLWFGCDGGVWRSDNRGDTWVDVNNNLAITQFTAGDSDPTDPDRAYGGTQDNGTMGWTGFNGWPHLDYGDGGFALIDQSTPNNLVHTYYNQSGNLIGCGYTTDGFATTMGGYSFSSAPANGISLSDRVLFYAPMHLDRNVSDTLYFGTNHLYRAPNFFATGGGFTALASGQDLTGGGGALSAIETVLGDANLIFTGSSSGIISRSINGGASFSTVDSTGAFASDILVDPANNDIVFASFAAFVGAGNAIRKSIDRGLTWSSSGSGIPDIPVNALAFDPVTPNRIWAGTDVGVYVSSNGGATWTPENLGLANVAVFDLKANGTTGFMVAFTHGRSAYRVSLDCSALSISGQPNSADACAGETVSFSVTAINADTYQWKKGTVELSGETDHTLTLTDVDSGDAGSYTCVVGNVCGSQETAPALLTITTLTYSSSLLPDWNQGSYTDCLNHDGSALISILDFVFLVN